LEIKGRLPLRQRITVFILFLCCVNLTAVVFAAQYPQPEPAFYVNDFARVLDAQTKAYLEMLGEALEEATTAQVVVVTVASLDGAVLEEYATGLFREWGIGSSARPKKITGF